MRLHALFALIALCAALGASTPRAGAAAPLAEEVLHLRSAEDSPREELVRALALNDFQALESLLDSRGIPEAVGAWHRSRIALAGGKDEEAWKQAWRARQHWRSLPAEFTALRPWFDHYLLALALDQARVRDAERILEEAEDPQYQKDPIWEALHARWLLEKGDPSNAALRIDHAWATASSSERGHRVFAHRAQIHLAGGDPLTAVQCWAEFLRSLRWARDKAEALRIWDGDDALRAAVERSHRRTEIAGWLSRNGRREEALEISLRAWRENSDGEAKAAYLLAAEQLYRLRRHEELQELLDERGPRHLDPEERAGLAAYPWGVARRSGASIEIARGFDDVFEEFPGTRRAVEALWEAAWMWELSGESGAAEERYLRYAREHPRAPFARAAALRALYLPFRQGRHELVLERLPELRRGLGDGAEEASGLWLAARSAEQLGQDARAEALHDELRKQHPDSPLLGGIPFPLEAGDPDFAPEALFEKQRAAFEGIAGELGVEGLWEPTEGPYREAQLLLGWGFFAEGERMLEDLARSRRRDPETQLRCAALAWAAGRAERQSRIGWWLRAVLRGRDEELDRALDIAFFPTPFADDILAGSERTGIPPGLLWGLMRRESFYEADVISRANAYGLLQLLPSTASRMAQRLGEEPFDDPRVLLDPGRNLRYGGEYLAKLLQECGGDPYQALAAYNAGESNGERWKQRMDAGAPPEELILVISYSETRAYVYHVLRHWKLYGRIHPSLAP